ncbi:MAG: PAS domain-containing protein [Panacagrimonas sp.]
MAALASAGAMLLHYSLDDLLTGHLPLMSSICAVIVAAWYGGLIPGCTAILLCTTLGVGLFAEAGLRDLRPGDQILLAGFLFLGGAISLMFEALRVANENLRRNRRDTRSAIEQGERSGELARDAERRRLMVMEASFDAIYEIDVPLDRVTWNDGITTLFGYPSRTIDKAYAWWSGRIHPDDRRQVLGSLLHAQRARSPRWQEEYRLRQASGEYIWVLDRAGLVFGPDGSITGAIGAVQDVSERRRTSEALAHFKALLEAQPAPILVCEAGAEFRIVAASNAYLRTTNTTREQIIGRPLFEAFPDDDDAAGVGPVRKAFQKVAATGKPEQLPVVCYAVPSPEGGLEKRWWSAYHFPVLGPRNEVTFVVQRADDVSEHFRGQSERVGETPAVPYDLRSLEQAQLLADANRRIGAVNLRLAFFAALADDTRALSDPLQIVTVTAEKLGRYLGVNRCVWVEIDASGDRFDVLADFRDGVAALTGPRSVREFGLPQLLRRGASSHVVADIDADPDARPYLPAYRGIGARALITVPLRKAGRTVAALAVQHAVPHRWTVDEVELVEQVAERSWEALERARAARAVAVSEARIRTLMDASPSKITTVDEKGHLTYLHPSWRDYAGLEGEGLDDSIWDQLLHPEDAVAYREHLRSSLVTGQPFSLEIRARHFSGEFRWHLARVVMVASAEGAPKSWLGVAAEVHDLKAAEQSLRERAQQLAFLVDLSGQIQALDDPDEILARVTDAVGCHLEADHCAYMRMEPEQDRYQVLAQARIGVNPRHVSFPLGEIGASVLRKLRANQPHVADGTQERPEESERRTLAGVDLRSAVFYPLHSPQGLAAGFVVYGAQPRAWSRAEIELVGIAARLCWAGVERANASSDLRISNEHLRFLAALSEAVQALSAPADIAQAVCDAMGARLSANRCVYLRVDADAGRCQPLAEFLSGVASCGRRGDFRRYGDAWWRQLESLRPLVIADVTHPGEFAVNTSACGEDEIGAVIVVPLHRGGRLVGLFSIQQREPRQWDDADLEVVDLAGNLCLESIQRAQNAEEEAASRQRLRDVLDRFPEKVFTMTPQGVIDYVSRATVEDLPTSPPVHAEGWVEFVHPEDRAVGEAYLARLLAGEHPGEIELRLRGRDQSHRWHVVRVALLPGPDGRPLQWVVAWSDRHDLKEAELRLRQADRAKDEFLATLAHELRNPIAPISNSVQLLQVRGEETALRTQVLALMARQITQMVRLVDDLLDVSRITSGKLVLRRETVMLADVVRLAVEGVDPLIRSGGHQLEVSLPEQPVALFGDGTRLIQALGNLLGNSAKYSEKPGTIWLRARCEGGQVRIDVEDQGIGIAPEGLPSVFNMFAQADRSLSRAQGGLGIGLSLVRRLVEMHGGRVEGSSPGLGHGSTFTIFLPLPDADGPGAATLTARPVTANPERASTGRRVLVADDNGDSARSLAALLRAHGHQVLVAHDGLAALEMAAGFHPEAMVLDIGMPQLDGLQTARRVRAGERGKDITLIALSGWGQPADRERTLAAGFDHHLVKPVDFTVLAALIDGSPLQA